MKVLDELTNFELYQRFVQEAKQGKALADGYTEMSMDVIEEIRRRVRLDNPDGFNWFYKLTRTMSLPPYGMRWIHNLYASNGRWVNKAFRGSTKTSTITESFTGYQIGLHPERSNGLVQADNKSALNHTSNVADMIAVNPGFRMLFPNVVPDEDKGWGADSGYWVKDKNVDSYGHWTQKRHQDPTLYGGSYGNAIHLGKHPTGVYSFDDINNDKNTESERRNSEVNRWVTDTIMPALENTAFRVVNQTPWTKRDALQLIIDTGVWRLTETPVMKIVPEGQGEHVIVIQGGIVIYDVWAELVWPSNFDAEKIAIHYIESGEKGFQRKYMLDLAAIEGILLRREWLHQYEREQLSRTLPVWLGVDYASTDKPTGREPDYFSITAVTQTGNGNYVVLDGFRGHVSQAEAEQKLKTWALSYPTLQTIGIETDGSGREFYNLMARHSELPIIELGTKGRSKGYRFEEIMAPYFEMARVWLAYPYTPFINTLIDEWVSWDRTKTYKDDTLDSTFYALAAAGLFLEEATPSRVRQKQSAWYEEPEVMSSPFAAFGRQLRGK